MQRPLLVDKTFLINMDHVDIHLKPLKNLKNLKKEKNTALPSSCHVNALDVVLASHTKETSNKNDSFMVD